MAIRLGAGRVLGRLKPRFKMPRWGVRGSLFAAFALIAGMGLVIAAGAGFVFNHLGATMMDLSGRDIPRLSASLQLASQSATLAAQGPGPGLRALRSARRAGGWRRGAGCRGRSDPSWSRQDD